MSKLYEISDKFKKLEQMAEEENIPAEALEDTFEALQGEFNDKATALVMLANNMDSDVDQLNKEINRLTAKRNAIKNNQERMRDYLRENMVANDIKKISCPLFSITCSQSTEIVVIDDESKIEDDFCNAEVVVKVDKVAIKKALKEGQAVAGARLEAGKARLTIK